MMQSIYLAIDIWKNRRRYDELHSPKGAQA